MRVHRLGYQKHAKLKKKGMKILHKYVFKVCYKNLLKSYVTHVFFSMILSVLVANLTRFRDTEA